MSQNGTPTADGLLQELLGCVWGRIVATPDDPYECPNRAVQIVVVHDGPRERALKLCSVHRDRILAATTPHEGHCCCPVGFGAGPDPNCPRHGSQHWPDPDGGMDGPDGY